MAASFNRRNRRTPAGSLFWSAYLGCSILLLLVLTLDPYFNRPSGWIRLELFTRKPVRHGFDPCAWDYDGSWKIGSFSGPSPTILNISTTPVITCADVTSASASFVRNPFVHIPGDGERLDPSIWTVFYELRNLGTYKSEIGVSESRDGGATWQHVGVALSDPHLSLSSPFVVYDAPSRLYVMLPDAQPHTPSSQRGRLSGLQAFFTTAEEFPRGWRPSSPSPSPGGAAATSPAATRARRLQNDPAAATHGSMGGAATDWDADSVTRSSGIGSSWGPSERGASLSGTTAVQVDGRWWIFTSRLQPPLMPFLPPRAAPLIFTAEGSLLSHWAPHPASGEQPRLRRGGAEGSGGSSSSSRLDIGGVPLRGALLSAGRPFFWQGAIHRWMHGRRCTSGLVLLRSTVANASHYEEEAAASYPPPRDRSWHARRIGHADVRPLPAGADRPGSQLWWGLVSGDRYADGSHHFVVHELWFVELKSSLRALVAWQLALVLGVVVLKSAVAGAGPRPEAERGSGGSGGGGGGGGGKARRSAAVAVAGDGDGEGADLGTYEKGGGGGGWCAPDNALRLWAVQILSRSSAGVAVLGAAEGAGLQLLGGLLRVAAAWGAAAGGFRRLGSQPRVQLVVHALSACVAGLLLAAAVMAALPSMVPCPRWTVAVRPLAPPHYVPAQPFVDPAAPFNVSSPPLVIVTGCTRSFMDRLKNLVGSLQYWAPELPIVVYDLGFSSEQLAQIRCWPGVELVRFPYEDYPPHVREINNYAFKPLLLQHALRRHPMYIWMDCGLEIRGPLDSVKEVLSRDGFVSAQQSDSPADYPYTEKYALPYFNISSQEYQRIKNLPFCASGLQGYVRGAASERLVLGPAVHCALHVNCTGAPGHSRAVSMYEQTALTLHIRMNNYSSCMPRETHCTSSVKKVAWDPTASSAPIMVASRRHRWPKPYLHRVVQLPGCTPDPSTNPWRSVSSEHQETVAKSSSLLFKLGFVYGQAAGDFIIQASCCLGFHILAQAILVAALLAGEALRRAAVSRALQGAALPPASTWLWLCRPQPLLAGLLLLVALMGFSLVTSCRAL